MRKYLFLLFSCNLCFADPFYPEPTAEKPVSLTEREPFADFSQDLIHCKPNANVEKIYLPLTFSDLTLVGIIKINDQFKTLFTDKNNKLIDLKTNDLLVSSQIQIEKINFKSVSLIDWLKTQDCQRPHKIQLKL